MSWNSGLGTESRRQVGKRRRYLGKNAEALNHQDALLVPRKGHVSLEDDSSREKLLARAGSEPLDSNARPGIESQQQQSKKTGAVDVPEATFRSLSNVPGHDDSTARMSVSSITSTSPRPTRTGNQLSARRGAQTERAPTRTLNAQVAKQVAHTKPVSIHGWDSTESHKTSSAMQYHFISANATGHELRRGLAQESNTLAKPFRTAIPKASTGSTSAAPALSSLASVDYKCLFDGDNNAINLAESFLRPTNPGPTVEATNSIDLSSPYNYNNIKCVDVKNARGPEYWNATNADDTVSTFISIPSCREGMRSRSKLPNANGPNWSVGAALFAQLDDADTFSCQMQKNPVMPPACEDVNGPGAAAMLTSIATAFNSFRMHWEALVRAGSQCQAQMNHFSDVFAPVPEDEGTIISIIVLTALIGGVAALLTGPVGLGIGIVVETAAGIGSGIGMEQYFASRPGAPDTSSDMGLISKRVHWAFGDVSDEPRNSVKNNANRLDYDQLQINVADGVNRLVGSATEQSAENPLEVSNSNLPFNLIVVPGPESDDAVHFWYADQYWTNDDEQCSVGEFKDGSQYDGSSCQMDYSFDCPLLGEAEEAPKSATVDHPLPGAAQNAYPGPRTIINTFTHRTSPTEAAAAIPTPNYANGVCAMRLTQYQKNVEDSNDINDYSIEISVKDAEGDDAASLPKSGAPKDKTLVMHG
ncbi:MAG: hypothetical protein Q9183_001833 [Haloplaca sp. 2 TL-2023]